jgi:hypothetical protein
MKALIYNGPRDVTTLNNLVRSVRFTGSLGVVGVSVPEDPGAPDDLARHGEVAFDVVLSPAETNGESGR